MKRLLVSLAVLALVLGFGALNASAGTIQLNITDIQSFTLNAGNSSGNLDAGNSGCVDFGGGTQCDAIWTGNGLSNASYDTSALAIGYTAGDVFVMPILNSNANTWTWVVTVHTDAGDFSESASFAANVTHVFSITLSSGSTITGVTVDVSGVIPQFGNDRAVNFIIETPEPGTLALLGAGLLGLAGLVRRRS